MEYEQFFNNYKKRDSVKESFDAIINDPQLIEKKENEVKNSASFFKKHKLQIICVIIVALLIIAANILISVFNLNYIDDDGKEHAYLYHLLTILLVFPMIYILLYLSQKNKKTNQVSDTFYEEKLLDRVMKTVFSNDYKYYPRFELQNNRYSSYGYNGGYLRDRVDKLMKRMIDDTYQEDFITGTYNNVEIIEADVVHTRYNQDNKIKYQFNGMVMSIALNKRCKSKVTIKYDPMIAESRITKSGLNLENNQFNKLFYVDCISKEDAYYILTPHLMEGLVNIIDFLKEHSVKFVFLDNVLTVVISDDRISFAGIRKNKTTQENIDYILSKILYGPYIIEELSLDNKLFLEYGKTSSIVEQIAYLPEQVKE